jgi:hypothetical protein
MLESSSPQFPSLNKSVFQVSSLFEQSDEQQYWLSQTPTTRLQALELTRKIIYGYDASTTRLQRVFEVTQLIQS